MSAYPLHGAVSLSNIPGPTGGSGSAAAASKTASNSLVPDYGIKNENIPNLSFSLNPPAEALKEDTDDEEIVKDEGNALCVRVPQICDHNFDFPTEQIKFWLENSGGHNVK